MHAREIRGKVKENEETGDINNKKSPEKHLMDFLNLSFGFLTLLHT